MKKKYWYLLLLMYVMMLVGVSTLHSQTSVHPGVFTTSLQTVPAAIPTGLTTVYLCSANFTPLSTGDSCVSWINDPGYWTSGIIGPGTNIHLCGIVTTQPIAQGSGTSGSPVTFTQENGASSPRINLNGNYIHVYIRLLYKNLASDLALYLTTSV